MFLLAGLLPTSGPVFAEEWQAQVLRVPGALQTRYVEDYATKRYGEAWEFETGLSGIDEKHGIRTLKTSDGRLSFKTAAHAWLLWGDPERRKDRDQEQIGSAWKEQLLPWVVRIKLQQSQKESDWYVEAAYLKHGKVRVQRAEAKLMGTEEQILIIPMGAAKATYHSLKVGTTTGNNQVSIDWVRVERPSALRYFHYSFELDGEPVTGGLALNSGSAYELYVNEQHVSSAQGQGSFGRKLNIVRSLPGLQQGRNTLVVVSDAYGSHSNEASAKRAWFFLQGAVVTQDGTRIPLFSNKSWRATYWASKEWISSKFDASGYSLARAMGSVRRNHLDGYGLDGIGQFREPPYFGRIRIGFAKKEYPFFRSNHEIQFDLQLIPQGKDRNPSLEYRVLDGDGRNQIARGNVQLAQQESIYRMGRLSLPALPAGVYQLAVIYRDIAGAEEGCVQEFVVIGKIKQKTANGASYMDGMKLHLTDEVDFSQGQPDREIRAGATMKRKPLAKMKPQFGVDPQGAFLVTGEQKGDWISFQFSNGHVYQPHLIEVEYPADTTRTAVFLVAEGTEYRRLNNVGPDGGIPRVAPGFYTDKGRAETERHSEYFLYWPNQEQATLTVVNAGRSGDPAAIVRARIYEIKGGLPAFGLGLDKGAPFVGPFIERIDRSVPRVFYAGPEEAKFSYDLLDGGFVGQYRAWYQAISNLIQFLRFTGQNTYFAGIYMYYGGWFPSAPFQGWPTTGNNYFGDGWDNGVVPLLAQMFEANDLNLVLGIQFIGSKALNEKDGVTDSDVAAGVDTLRFVASDGQQVFGFQNEGFNFLHPQVASEMERLAEEVAERYSAFPAIKGVTWTRLPEFPLPENKPSLATPLEIGYGDTTISYFERETGIKIPVSALDPERFGNRYEWLRKNRLEEWIAWRTDKVYQMDAKLHQILSAKRPGWRYWHLTNRPRRRFLAMWSEEKIHLKDIYRYAGLDPELYRNSSKLSLVPFYELTGQRLLIGWRPYTKTAEVIPRFNEALLTTAPFKNVGLFVHIGFMIETKLQSEGSWPWQKVPVVGYAAPAGEEFYEKLIPTAADRDAIIIGWGDVGQFTGHEQAIRELVKAIQSKKAR